MRSQLSRPGLLFALTGLVTAALVAGPGAAAPVQATTSLRATPSPAAPPASRQAVTLLNGDRVIMRQAADHRFGVIAPPGRGGARNSVLSLSLGGKEYVIPATALSYLGRGLSLSLFQLGALQRLETGGRLPVRVSFHRRRPALPGVHITSSGSGTAAGYLTAASARRFGSALARQATSSARSAGGGLFANGASMALAGPASPVSARPGYAMHTLTVTGTDLAGQPAMDGTVFVSSVDNSTRFAGQNVFYRGTLKFSVPAGHYWAVAVFMQSSGQNFSAQRVVVLPQFTVTGQHTAVHVAEQAASSEVTMVTPRPADPENSSVEIRRPGRAGPVQYWEFLDSGLQLWVSPTSIRPTVGKLQTFTAQQLTSPPGQAGTAYEYDLAYRGPSGIIPRQRHRVPGTALATVDARYYQDLPSTGNQVRFGMFPGQLGDVLLEADNPFPLPRHQTEYLTGNPSLDWFDSVSQFPAWSSSPGGQDDAARSFRAGSRAIENWNAYPLHPGPDVNLRGAANPVAALPSASRAGNMLALDVTPFSDSQPGHLGTGFSAASYEIDQNGVRLATGQAAGGTGPLTLRVSLAHRPAIIRFALSASRSGKSYPLSAQSRTVWTWRSAAGPGATLPPGWRCPASAAGPPLQRCDVQPMLTLRYAISRLALDGSAPAGAQQLAITPGHLPLAHQAGLAGLLAWVSFNDGHSWRAAPVTRRSGSRFTAGFTAPPGALVTLRVQATDTMGASITETIRRAYRIGAGGAQVRPASAPRPQPAAVPRMTAACPAPPPGAERCFALYAPQPAVNAAIAAGVRGPAAAPTGWGARDIESAYQLPVSRHSHQTIAVVDAFDTPHLGRYLGVYRKHYGLPACSVRRGCLREVSQDGSPGPLPPSGVPYGWDVETMLDVSMISAACPHCRILVVEAADPAAADLAAAEDTAVRLGAQVISNSYGTQENSFVQGYARDYRHPGHAIVVSSGDSGFGPANFPANLASVTAVGGTELARSRTARGWRETVWNNEAGGASGSGCSAYVRKPAWQHDRHCSMRTVADVSAVASGVALYDARRGGWLTVAGTSVAAPLIAGIYGLAGNAGVVTPRYPYQHARSLFDIRTGSSVLRYGGTILGSSCGGDYLCTGRAGYDAPTGLGSPDGTSAF